MDSYLPNTTLDTSSKSLLDALRIIARNAFYRSIGGFKESYDNCRDDHDHWRELSRSAGVLESTKSGIVVHLIPQANHSPKLASVIENELKKWLFGKFKSWGRNLRVSRRRREEGVQGGGGIKAVY